MLRRITFLPIPAAIVALAVLGCRGSQDQLRPAGGEVPSSPSVPGEGGQGSRAGAAADTGPARPPLQKKPITSSNLKPFDKPEDWIAYLDKKERDAWQKPDEVVASLSLTGKETVADLGAGSGYFTFRLSRALPAGKVIAIEVEPVMVQHIRHKAMNEGLMNIDSILAVGDDPSIPGGVDLVFICNVLHHVAGSKSAWLSKLSGELRAGAKVVLIEFKEGNLPEGPPESVKISRTRMVELAVQAGLSLDSEKVDLLPYQTFLVFRKAS